MPGDQNYFKLFKLSEFLNARWPNYLNSILSYIWIQTHMGQRYQISQSWYSKDEKSKAVSKLERIEKKEYSDGSNIWKEGILRWVEYLTKTVWIASSRQRLLPHQGWFPPCLLSIVWTGCGRDEEVAREMMMNCYEDHIHTSTLLCYFSLFSGCWNMTIIYLGN